MTSMSVDGAFVALAFVLGGLMSRTSVCTVAGLQQWIVARRVDGMLHIAMLVAGAAVVLLGTTLLWPEAVALPASLPIDVALVVGAVLLGLGSVVNGACYLGSLQYLGRGKLAYVATLVGLVLGVVGMSHVRSAATMPAMAALDARAAVATLFGLALAALAGGVVYRCRRQRTADAQHGVLAVTIAAGVTAGLIYTRHPDWNYGTVLVSIALAPLTIDWATQAAALALLGGTVLGAVHAHRFHLERPAPGACLRRLLGGCLMGGGAALIPGGHDLLLLWSIPGLAVQGVVAYGIVALTVAAVLAAGQHRRRAA